MSGFDRTLRGLSSREMLECARGLLACLTDGEGGSLRGAADIAEIEPVGRRGERPEAGRTRKTRAGGEMRGAEIRRRAGYEYGAGEYHGRRGSYEMDMSDAGPGGGSGEDVTAESQRREGDFYGRAEPAARGDTSGGWVNTAPGAAFCGPERRYDGAVGARGMEMSRVSEFFRRDSRRYDAGCMLK